MKIKQTTKDKKNTKVHEILNKLPANLRSIELDIIDEGIDYQRYSEIQNHFEILGQGSYIKKRHGGQP